MIKNNKFVVREATNTSTNTITITISTGKVRKLHGQLISINDSLRSMTVMLKTQKN